HGVPIHRRIVTLVPAPVAHRGLTMRNERFGDGNRFLSRRPAQKTEPQTYFAARRAALRDDRCELVRSLGATKPTGALSVRQFFSGIRMSRDINLRSGSIVTEKRSGEMSLLDTIEPALKIDPGGPVPPVGVTNLEKFLRAGIPVIMFQKVAVSVLLGPRAPCDQIQGDPPIHQRREGVELLHESGR